MAVKNRPGSARGAFGRQQAELRRGAPGKRFIGDTAEQRAEGRRAELDRVDALATADLVRRRAEEPLSDALLAFLDGSLALARTIAWAPLRIARALVLAPPREA